MKNERPVIYVNGILSVKECIGVIFYGEIKKLKKSKCVVNCRIYTTINNISWFKRNRNKFITGCLFTEKTKKEIMKELNLDFWGQSRKIRGTK